MPLLMCLREKEANYVLRKVHMGICGNHAAGSSLALKALRNGYFWPTMKADALDLVKKCDKCQRHAHVPRKPSIEQTPLVVAWPFDQWGIDLLGPFPIALGQLKYLIVVIEYFMKWIEAKPLATISARNI